MEVVSGTKDAEPNWSAVAALADSLLSDEALEAEAIKEIVRHWQG